MRYQCCSLSVFLFGFLSFFGPPSNKPAATTPPKTQSPLLSSWFNGLFGGLYSPIGASPFGAPRGGKIDWNADPALLSISTGEGIPVVSESESELVEGAVSESGESIWSLSAVAWMLWDGPPAGWVEIEATVMTFGVVSSGSG